jgi:hypothetical protein
MIFFFQTFVGAMALTGLHVTPPQLILKVNFTFVELLIFFFTFLPN